jgi:acyl dehydratase
VKTFEELNIGDTLGPLDVTVTKDQCRNYAKVSGFGEVAGRFTDDEAARKEGLPGIILPGNMSLGLLSKLVTDWIGPSKARLTRLSTTYRVPVQPDHPITIHGFVTNTNPADRTAEIDVWMENEDAERLVTGTATVEFQKKI